MSPRKRKQYMIFMTTSKEFFDQMTYWSKKFGVTKSMLGNICMQAGLGAVARAISQEGSGEFYGIEKVGKLIDKEKMEGVELELSEEGLQLEVSSG